MTGSLEILESGLLTTIQDIGRRGHRRYGIPVSGVMDDHAYRIANWLAFNPENAPVLECTLKAPVIRFKTAATIGISGASAQVRINEKVVDVRRSLRVEADDILRIANFSKGCRVYISINGEWNLDKVMGSYATCLPANFGGYNGRPLKKGDILSWTSEDQDQEIREVPAELIPHYASRQIIRIIQGPEWDWLELQQQEQLTETEFEISPQSNRMGIRLISKVPVQISKTAMKSAPVTIGMIQLPASGHPIILMNDAQSVGGYPRIAKVADADLWRLGQTWSPVKIKFKVISYKKAKSLSAFRQKLLL